MIELQNSETALSELVSLQNTLQHTIEELDILSTELQEDEATAQRIKALHSIGRGLRQAVAATPRFYRYEAA